MRFLMAASYPHVAGFIRAKLPKVAARKRVFDALIRHGHLEPEKARRILGEGPDIKLVVIDLPPWRHGTAPGVGDAIHLARVVARQYEKLMEMAPLPGRRLPEVQRLTGEADAMLEAIILHYVVNWGVRTSGQASQKISLGPQNEPGDEFEAHAYGGGLSKTPIPGWIGWGYVQDGDFRIARPYDEQPGYPPRMPSAGGDETTEDEAR